VLAAWVPGDDGARAPSGTAFRLAPGETLRLRVQYAKNWQDELVEKSDRSSIGLYFGDAPVTGRGIESLATPQQTVSTPVRVLSVTPLLDRDYESVSVEAVLPAGKRTLLLKLRAPRASWSRRYWLMEPIELPRNSRIEVTTEGAPGSPRIALDFVPL
jgi:hypothetical protein